MGKLKGSTVAISISAMVALTGCEDGKGQGLEFLKKKPGGEAAAPQSPQVTRAAASTSLIERDVEAPNVFSKTEDGLWDGRPSLGGVWIAHEDVKKPERVLIRNEANGKTVIGALFERERVGAGPSLQLSSDAADALVVVAGAPVKLSVVALRKEELPQAAPEAEIAGDAVAAVETEAEAEASATSALAEAEGTQTVPETGDIATASLDAVEETPKKTKKPWRLFRRAAKDKPAETAVEAGTEVAANAVTPELATKTAIKPIVTPVTSTVLGSRLPKKTGQSVDPLQSASAAIARSSDKQAKPIKASARATGPSKAYIQIGIFSVKGNADNTATSLRNVGILPTVKQQTSKGKVFWRVVVGPATSSSERGTLLKKVKKLGFNDAYFVTN